MTTTSQPIIFSSEVVDSLPLYYRALAHHLAKEGKAVIKKPLETSDALE